jgi:high affinity Mn2+ porin
MHRTCSQVRASPLRSAVVWLSCAIGAPLLSVCASLGQQPGPSDRGSPPDCACQSVKEPDSKPANQDSTQPARRKPRTFGQAVRAYLECLHRPLSERGPSQKAIWGQGDAGTSRYPAAEGERGFERPRGMGDRARSASDAGMSRYPPAEGERNVAPGRREPTPPPQPDDEDDSSIPQLIPLPNGPQAGAAANPVDDEIIRADTDSPASYLARLFPGQTFGADGGQDGPRPERGDTGLSRYPPAEGVRTEERAAAPTISNRLRYNGVCRNPPAEGERATPYGTRSPFEDVWYSVHEQATVISQVHNVFPSPYIGPNSLHPNEPASNSMTGTIFLAARLWESQHCDTQLIFNPEVAGGNGFSHVMGIAGYPNGELTRVGVENPTPYIARLYLRQTIGLGGEREYAADDINQVAGERDVRRLAVIVGKFAAPDIADDNRYAHDPRTQFLNWALVYNGAWDYPANVRGYTYGVAFDYNHSKNLSFSYAVMAEPLFANGAPLDPDFLKAQGQVLEMENRYDLFGRPGAARLMTYLNHAHMGDYNEALQLMPVDPVIAKTRSYRYKYGFGLSLDQELTDDIGFFTRLGWDDGHTETWAFTEIDRTASAGFVMGGRLWCRPYDQIGLAGVLNGLSGPHREYLAAGGLGFIIGDGKLNYGLEQTLEFYYDLQVRPGLVFTFDFQQIVNPAYNRDRGPVSVASIRIHWDR